MDKTELRSLPKSAIIPQDNMGEDGLKEKMKSLRMLVWLTQLGLSVAFPLAGFLLLALWLRQRFSLGSWVLFVGLIFGLVGAVDGFCSSLKAMDLMARDKKENDAAPPISFNDHS